MLRSNVFQTARWHEKRRGVRVNARVRVAIEAEDSSGQAFSEEAHTRMVNPYGCLVVLRQDLTLGQQVRCRNLANDQEVLAVVVWKGKQRSEGWEWGIELVDPQMDFWEMEL